MSAQEVPSQNVDVIIPALNEAESLPWVLDRIPSQMRAIVVDNNSTDDTAAVAARHGALVVGEPIPGFGSACWAGLLASSAEIVCFLDGDGSLDPQQLCLVVDPVRSGEFDLMLGARQVEPGAMQVHQRAANRFLAHRLTRVTKTKLTDLGPMRAVRRQPLLDLGMEDRRSGWPLEMVLKGARAGWRIGEVPVRYDRRRGGTSKVTGTAMGTLRAVKDMSRLLATYKKEVAKVRSS